MSPKCKGVRVMILGLNCITQRFRICAGVKIDRASVDVTHVDLIEHIIECMPIVHVGLQAG